MSLLWLASILKSKIRFVKEIYVVENIVHSFLPTQYCHNSFFIFFCSGKMTSYCFLSLVSKITSEITFLIICLFATYISSFMRCMTVDLLISLSFYLFIVERFYFKCILIFNPLLIIAILNIFSLVLLLIIFSFGGGKTFFSSYSLKKLLNMCYS